MIYQVDPQWQKMDWAVSTVTESGNLGFKGIKETRYLGGET